MSNEEFQSLVLEELRGIRGDISGLKQDVSSLKEDVTNLGHRLERVENRLESVENRLVRVENKLDAVYDRAAAQTEFRTETKRVLDYLLDQNRSIYEILGRHEIDITTLKRKYA